MRTPYGTASGELLDLPPDTALFVGHDYCKDKRDPQCMATVAEHRRSNIHVKDAIDEEELAKVRSERDATLPLPVLMLAALQVNIRVGAASRARPFLRIPVTHFKRLRAETPSSACAVTGGTRRLDVPGSSAASGRRFSQAQEEPLARFAELGGVPVANVASDAIARKPQNCGKAASVWEKLQLAASRSDCGLGN